MEVVPIMKLRSLVVAGAAVVATAAIAPAAQAADQVVTGTTIGNSIAVTIPSVATFGTGLSNTADATATAVLPVVGVGDWTLSVNDKSTASNGSVGHLVRDDTSCTTGSAFLTNAVNVYPTATLGNFTPAYTSGSPYSLTGTAHTIASGTGVNSVSLNWVQPHSTSDQLTALCVYKMTTDVTATGS